MLAPSCLARAKLTELILVLRTSSFTLNAVNCSFRSEISWWVAESSNYLVGVPVTLPVIERINAPMPAMVAPIAGSK